MQDEDLSTLAYWSEMLTKTVKRLEPYQEKLIQIPIETFTYEDHVRLRHILLDIQVETGLLERDIQKAKKRKPPTFLQRLFNK